jgi:hypothetical protein
MRTVEKTTRKVVIEMTMEEIAKKGFESLWDEVRSIYPISEYELLSVTEHPARMLVITELKSKKF